MTLTDPTVGHLADAATARLTKRELQIMLLKVDVERYAPNTSHQPDNKVELVLPRLRSAQKAAQRGDDHAHGALLDFARAIIQSVADPNQPPDWFGELRDALLADGYEVTWDRVEKTVPGNFGPPSTRVKFVYEILPTDAAPVPLAAEISALERELDSQGHGDALNHYRQAINAFKQHDYEAANGQLRTTLEALVMRLAEVHTPYAKPAKAGDGGNAINRLRGTPNLTDDDGGEVLHGLWRMSCTKGSHPGMSNADETRFRVQVITATARLLLHRFP